MTCKDIQTLILIDQYQELSADGRERLRSHLEQCQECQNYADENRLLFDLLEKDEAEEIRPRWDECWQRIEEQVAIEDNKKKVWLPLPQWGMALAASLVLLVIGFFLGRTVWPPLQPDRSMVTQVTPQGENSMVRSYLEDLKPIMVDLANYQAPASGRNGGPVEKEIVNNMLMQTRLLKKYFKSQNNANINMLLEEMEMILMDLNNIEPGDSRSIKSIQGIIREKGIPLKIKLFEQKTNEVTKI
jgi:hypothetical protein